MLRLHLAALHVGGVARAVVVVGVEVRVELGRQLADGVQLGALPLQRQAIQVGGGVAEAAQVLGALVQDGLAEVGQGRQRAVDDLRRSAIVVMFAAVLFELSLVTRPAYHETDVSLRQFQWDRQPVRGLVHPLNRWRA